MEKQAYALVKKLKDFKFYILQSHVVTYVPSTMVKYIRTQPNLDGRRSRWITSLL